MAYINKIDHNERKIYFAVHHYKTRTSRELDQFENNEEESEEPGKKIRITKATMMKRFLKENEEYFTITQVSEMLKVAIKTLRKSVIADKLTEKGEKKYPGQYKLETYEVEYYYSRYLSSDIADWEKSKQSNLVTLVHYRDLYNFLLQVIESSYEFTESHSVLDDPDENYIKDAYHRTKKTTEWMAQKDIYVLLKHQHTKSEIEELVEKIIRGEYELHSLASLKEIVKKGDTTYERLTKSLDSIKIKLNENNIKPTSRYVFLKRSDEEEEQEKAVANELLGLLSIIGNHKVAIIPKQLPAHNHFQELDFEEPIDYLSLYIEGYEGLPQGYYRAADGLLYFAVEAADTELEGININTVRRPEEKVDKEAIREFLEVAYNVFEKRRKK